MWYIHNIILDKRSYNWHDNVLEVYEDYDLFEPTIVEGTISRHSEIRASVSTKGMLLFKNNYNFLVQIYTNYVLENCSLILYLKYNYNSCYYL